MITNSVFVLSKNGKILKPTTPARARILQAQGKAKKLKLYPFTLILDKEVSLGVEPYLELRIDPGSKFTGFAKRGFENKSCRVGHGVETPRITYQDGTH